jgi:hypothetical protein
MEDHRIRQDYARKQLDEFDRSFVTGNPHELNVDHTRALTSLAARLYSVMTDAHALGMAYLLPVAFQMHHDSLMSTFWTAKEVDRLEHTQYEVCQVPTGSDRCFCVTDYRGKVVKAPGYTPPHISDLFESLAGQELFDFEHAVRLYYNTDESELEEQPEPFIFPDLSDEEEVWKDLD